MGRKGKKAGKRGPRSPSAGTASIPSRSSPREELLRLPVAGVSSAAGWVHRRQVDLVRTSKRWGARRRPIFLSTSSTAADLTRLLSGAEASTDVEESGPLKRLPSGARRRTTRWFCGQPFG